MTRDGSSVPITDGRFLHPPHTLDPEGYRGAGRSTIVSLSMVLASRARATGSASAPMRDYCPANTGNQVVLLSTALCGELGESGPEADRGSIDVVAARAAGLPVHWLRVPRAVSICCTGCTL